MSQDEGRGIVMKNALPVAFDNNAAQGEDRRRCSSNALRMLSNGLGLVPPSHYADACTWTTCRFCTVAADRSETGGTKSWLGGSRAS